MSGRRHAIPGGVPAVAALGLATAISVQLESSARGRAGILDELGLAALCGGVVVLLALADRAPAAGALIGLGLVTSGIAAHGADVLSTPLLVALLATVLVARDLALRPALAVATGLVLAADVPDAVHRAPLDAAGTVVGEFVYFALPFALGRALRAAQELNARLDERNRELRDERERRAALATLEERSRLGDELRTLVIDGLRTMLVAARRVPPELREVEAVGRATLAGMRAALGDLATGPELPALPGLAALSSLRSDVPLVVERSLPHNRLSRGLDAACYRIVEAALAAAALAGASVSLCCDQAGDEVTLRLRFSGGSADELDAEAAAAIRERVALYGGDLRTTVTGPRTFDLRVGLVAPAIG